MGGCMVEERRVNFRSLLTSVATTPILVVLSLAVPAGAQVQGRGNGAPPPPTPRATAPIELTGYWVSIVTEDWRVRMVTPEKGDIPSVPLNPEGRQVANTWDPAKDEADGNQCKAYAAPALLRVPGR